MNLEPMRRFLNAHRLPMAIGAAVLIALLMTVISISLYIRSGASRLDLSRPGYEGVRKQVTASEDDEILSATGPMDVKTIDTFQTMFNKRRSTLDKLDPFTPSVLDDSSIRLLESADQPQQ